MQPFMMPIAACDANRFPPLPDVRAIPYPTAGFFTNVFTDILDKQSINPEDENHRR